jgi:plasmid maintenance system antidote protein VapI
MPNPRQETKDAIRFLDIPKIQLARMVGLEPSRISEYVRDKSLSADKTEKIENAVRQIAKVWTVLPIRVDLNDLEGFARAVKIADFTIEQADAEDAAARLQHHEAVPS